MLLIGALILHAQSKAAQNGKTITGTSKTKVSVWDRNADEKWLDFYAKGKLQKRLIVKDATVVEVVKTKKIIICITVPNEQQEIKRVNYVCKKRTWFLGKNRYQKEVFYQNGTTAKMSF